MNRHIFLDADGVLAGFDEGFETRFGVHPRTLKDPELWGFVNSVDDYWINLPLKEGAKELYSVVEQYGQPTILTGCPRTGYDIADIQKRQWFLNHFGAHVPVITCRSKDKPIHMKNPGDILIDDFIANVKRWKTAGGISIYFKTSEQAIDEVNYHMNKKNNE